jgi:hypothetical protein
LLKLGNLLGFENSSLILIKFNKHSNMTINSVKLF